MTPDDVKKISLLNEATQAGHIRINRLGEKQSYYDNMYMARLPSQQPIPPEQLTDSPAMNMATEQPRDSILKPSYGPWALLEFLKFFELARFYVPYGMYGVITNIDQAVQMNSPLPGGDYLSRNEYRGRYDVEHTYDLSLRWFLRLSHWPAQGIGEPIVGLTDARSLPGIPYNYLGMWEDTRFIWGMPEQLHYPVQGGFVLRLFGEIVDAGDISARTGMIAGRLQGYVQRANSHAAAWTSRRQW